ncbi:uncharacterized protein LOC135698597 [Ochlerotatus camptorhynchus]|uniref:uncharacterized protein LOC135698597 n=1 Tax=Ochlerotatus camptorhynchus TaxID=644619 RepID=UPI0031E0E83A
MLRASREQTTTWHFIPLGTPHMGGVWERVVRSVKEAMCALDDGRQLTDEILETALAEAADMINTRPLTYLPQGSDETEALTQNHFLRGTVSGADLKVDGTDTAESCETHTSARSFLQTECGKDGVRSTFRRSTDGRNGSTINSR